MRLKSRKKQFDESSESNFTTTKSLYLIKSTDDMIESFRDKGERLRVRSPMNFTQGWSVFRTVPRLELSRYKNILCDEVVGMWPKGDARRTSSCLRYEGKRLFRLKTLTQEVVCIYKAPVCVPESICVCGGGGGGNKCTTCDPIRRFIPAPLWIGVNPTSSAGYKRLSIQTNPHFSTVALTY